jgi:hypothetical protein
VRIDGCDDGAPRPVTGQPAGSRLYRATLASTPRALTSIAAGAPLRFLADPGGRHPLMVTDAYLDERAHWQLTPCPRCGLHEGLDPPSLMAATRFPELAADARPLVFAAPCPACTGTLELSRVDAT